MPIRRSERRPKKNQTADIIQKLQNIGSDDSRLPLEIRDIPGKNCANQKAFKVST